ncbi:TetR/AcrR family transcriptional regulator [Anaerosphaera multitolerans]|uniref:TetR family transcriptional regulator n=1 Tax=Anaerosphaera multitolerans TaxID=2487351 RepID=A0A437S4R1_9FIRM|nr:TetR/AcrR family transcriptional regulator [Anaerosphaera multitolerans]RVU54022.1 TetR family transcriptional regulator [Anaerosphaera multitolerans]
MAKQYTKETIQSVFIEMLNERPLSKITIKEIAERSEINRNTFYYHYEDIYELLSEIFQKEIETFINEYNDTLSWEDSFISASRFALENKKAIYHIYNSMQREELRDYIYNVAGEVMGKYVERVNRNIGASKEDEIMVKEFYQCALTEMVLRWISTGMKEDPNLVIKRIGKLFDGNIERSLSRSGSL